MDMEEDGNQEVICSTKIKFIIFMFFSPQTSDKMSANLKMKKEVFNVEKSSIFPYNGSI